MESSKHPGKSILKDNTLPLFNNKRRVSFAPQVTLHQFNLVPYASKNNDTKRRRTMGMIPLPSSQDSAEDSQWSSSNSQEHDPEDAGLEMLHDSSDDEPSNGLVNVQAPHGSADTTSASAAVNLQQSDGAVLQFSSSDDEQEKDMELTGTQIQKSIQSSYELSPISLPPKLNLIPGPGFDEGEVTMDLTNYASGVPNVSTSTFPSHPNKVQTQLSNGSANDPAYKPSMDPLLNSPRSSKFPSLVPKSARKTPVADLRPSVEQNGSEQRAPERPFHPADDQEEFTMEITQVFGTITRHTHLQHAQIDTDAPQSSEPTESVTAPDDSELPTMHDSPKHSPVATTDSSELPNDINNKAKESDLMHNTESPESGEPSSGTKPAVETLIEEDTREFEDNNTEAMEETQVFGSIVRPVLQAIDDEIEIPALEVQDDEQIDSEDTGDITIAVREIRSSVLRYKTDESENEEEQTMDITEQFKPIVHSNPNEDVDHTAVDNAGNIPSDQEEQTMEFTQAISKVTIIHHSEVANTRIDEKDEVESESVPTSEHVQEKDSQATHESNEFAQPELPVSESEIIKPAEVPSVPETQPHATSTQEVANVVHDTDEGELRQTPLEKIVPTNIIEKEVAHDEPETLADPDPDPEFLGSQPMQITQEDDPTTALPSSSETPQGHVTTSTIPLADTSRQEDDIEGETFENQVHDESHIDADLEGDEEDNYSPVGLSDFMSDIGVKFYDDLDIDINSVNRLSLTATTDLSEPSISDYILALPKLDYLALYQFSCEELNKNIIEGKRVFSEFNKTIRTNNPPLFKEYYSANEHDRVSLNVKLQLIKDFTRHQSKITWYDWRSQLTSNLKSELAAKYEELVQDKAELTADLRNLDSVCKMGQEQYELLKDKLAGILHFKKQFRTISDPAKLLTLKEEIMEVSQKLHSSQVDIESLKSKLGVLEQTIQENKKHRLQLMQDISLAEKAIVNNKKYVSNDITFLIAKFKFLERFANLKFKKFIAEGKVLEFAFDKLINLKMDFSKTTNNIQYSIIPHSASDFHNEQLLEKYYKLVEDTTNGSVVDSFKKFREKWSVFRALDKDIFKLSIKFPIKFVDDEDNIKFTVRYFNFRSSYGLQVTVSIPFSDLSRYPENVRLEATTTRSSNEVKDDLTEDLSTIGLTSQLNIQRILLK